MTNSKTDHFQHVGSIRLNRVQYMEAALSEHHNATELPKLRYLPDLPNPMREVVLAALATSEQATNHFLASLAQHKRCEAKAKQERHKAGVEKRRGKRGPNARTIMAEVAQKLEEAVNGQHRMNVSSDEEPAFLEPALLQDADGNEVRPTIDLVSEGHQKSVDAAKKWMANRPPSRFTSRMVEDNELLDGEEYKNGGGK